MRHVSWPFSVKENFMLENESPKPKPLALITGVGRLKGIGRAICLALAHQNVDIFFSYWSPYDTAMLFNEEHVVHDPVAIQREIQNLGVRCKSTELDLTTPHAPQLLLSKAKHAYHRSPNILVNNATYSTTTPWYDFNEKELDQHYAVNIKATTLLTLAFVQQLEQQPSPLPGRIINLTSGQSLGPMPNELAYAMTKSAIETLTRTLASELATKQITINAVNPGPNDTGWIPDSLQEPLRAQFPMGRIGRPTDTANLIAFLASEAAQWITGQVIHSEGGFKRSNF